MFAFRPWLEEEEEGLWVGFPAATPRKMTFTSSQVLPKELTFCVREHLALVSFILKWPIVHLGIWYHILDFKGVTFSDSGKC